MKILYVCQYFPPEVCALAVRAQGLAQEWVRAGHEVSILTGFPNHPEGVIHPGYRRGWYKGLVREEQGGVRVYRAWLVPAANRGFWGRSANYLSFALSAAITGSWAGPHQGIVIATSPPLPVAAAGYVIARLRGLPFIFEVRDLWPESLEAVGVASRHSLLYRGLQRLAHFLYRRADRIVVDGEWKRRALAASSVSESRMVVIRNGVAEDFCPAPESPQALETRQEIRAHYRLEGKFIALYCGTLGMAHGLETVLAAARRLQSRREILFLLAGEGAEREKICRRLLDGNLTNVKYLGKHPRESVPALLAMADVCLVPLRKSDVFQTAIPSKMFEAMCAAKPIILGVGGDAKELLLEAQAGMVVPPEDADALAEAVIRLQKNPELARRLGANGRRATLERFTRRRQATAYLELLREVTAAPSFPRLRPSPARETRPVPIMRGQP